MVIRKVSLSDPKVQHLNVVKTDKNLGISDLNSKFASDIKSHLPPKPIAFKPEVKELFAPLQSRHGIASKSIASIASLIFLDSSSLNLIKHLKQPPS